MTPEGLARFNELPRVDAEERLYSCFANRGWAATVTAGRPYPDLTALLSTAEIAWARLAEADWLGAFAAHPRIGERGGHSPVASEREQSRVVQAPPDTLAELAAENRLYEDRFGRVFLIAASGRTAEEMLEALRERLRNDPATELEVAANEQRKITQLRLEQLVNE